MGAAGGATLGMAGRFGRGTVGRAGQALGDSEKLKAAVARGGAGGIADAADCYLASARKFHRVTQLEAALSGLASVRER